MTDELDESVANKERRLLFLPLWTKARAEEKEEEKEEEEGPELRPSGLKPLISCAPLTHFVSAVRCGCCGTKRGEVSAENLERVKTAPHAGPSVFLSRVRMTIARPLALQLASRRAAPRRSLITRIIKDIFNRRAAPRRAARRRNGRIRKLHARYRAYRYFLCLVICL